MSEQAQARPETGAERLREETVTSFRRIADEQLRMRIGKVVSVSGSRVLMMIDLPEDHEAEHMPRIGDAVCIETGRADLVTSVSGLSAPAAGIGEEEGNVLIAELGIIGEFRAGENGARLFRRGITAYPSLGDIAASLTLEDKAVLYGTHNENYYRVGEMSDGSALPAVIDAKALLDSNFAIIGMSGAGKTCAAASIVRTLIQNRHPCRTVVIDLNNEYTNCFGKVANIMRLGAGSLSHWMLTFRELVHMIMSSAGRLSEAELELLGEAVCAARRRYLQANPSAYVREGTELSTVNVDMPLPYRFSDVVGDLDRSAHTDQRYDGETFRRLRTRLVTVAKDPHFKPFLSSAGAQDSLAAFLSKLLRIPVEGKPVTVLQLADQAQDVAEVVVSAVSRYMQLVASATEQSTPFLLLLEEAHRFLPADPGDASLSSRTLGKIIEKSGKNNVSIGMITSQPRSLSTKAWEYCNTVFAMRMASTSDRDCLHEVTPESATDTLSSVGVLGNGEAAAVGQGAPVPIRFRFRRLPGASLPSESRSRRVSSDGLAPLNRTADKDALQDVLDNWRYGVGQRD